MKILVVFEYPCNSNEEYDVEYSLTAIDSHRTGYAGNMTISKFDITRYADIFFVECKQDVEKFKKSGLDMDSFIPAMNQDGYFTNYSTNGQHQGNHSKFSKNVVDEMLRWAKARRMWVYKSIRMVGPDRTKFENFFKKLQWQYND